MSAFTSIILTCLFLIGITILLSHRPDRRDAEREKLAEWLQDRSVFTMRQILKDALGLDHDTLTAAERKRIATRLRTEFGCRKETGYLWKAPQPPRVLPLDHMGD